MNEKKNLQDILGQIAEDAGVSKKATETFIKTLFDIITEALEKDGIAKIPKLGTFKVTSIEERKSVNIQDGSEMIIPAHKKVSFTPEKELKEEINKPFAHLETYVINDNAIVDPEEDDDEESINEEIENPTNASTLANQTTNNDGNDKNGIIPEDSIKEEGNKAITPEQMANAFKPADVEPDTNKTNDSSETLTAEGTFDPIANIAPSENIGLAGAETQNTTASFIADTANEANTSEVSSESVSNIETVNTQDTDSEVSGDAVNEQSVKITEGIKQNDTKEIQETNNTQSNASITEKEQGKKKGKKKQPKEKSYLWLLWLLLGVILIVAALFAIKYTIEKDKEIQKQREQIENLQQQPSEEVPATQPQETELVDETSQEIDCFEHPELCQETNEANNEESSFESIDEENPSTELHRFDESLTNYMREHHSNLNFPTEVPIREYYTVKEGSRLAQVSRNIYDGVFNYWVYIYLFNTDVLSSPNDVKPDMTLKIPDLSTDFINGNSSKTKNLADEISANVLSN